MFTTFVCLPVHLLALGLNDIVDELSVMSGRSHRVMKSPILFHVSIGKRCKCLCAATTHIWQIYYFYVFALSVCVVCNFY